ncbi:MAG TPA: GntR family transcriptional regulator [Pseudonocardiaceae bacterium]|nr:GntR family transcriptional regulator [Pseudonocardiaceae bacterium]
MSTQPTSRPARLLTLAGHAEQLLREMIFSGELAPGVRISADDAARRLGMSAIPVREALRSLASRGLVESIARRGFRVRAADQADLAETYQLRMLLDPFATTLAVPRMDASALAAMDAAMDTFERTVRAGDVASYDADHRAFHFSVYDHAGSRWLTDIQAMLWENSRRYQRLSAALRGSAADRVAEHRAIADACRRGTAGEAAGLVHDHLARTEQLVTAELEEHR